MSSNRSLEVIRKQITIINHFFSYLFRSWNTWKRSSEILALGNAVVAISFMLSEKSMLTLVHLSQIVVVDTVAATDGSGGHRMVI